MKRFFLFLVSVSFLVSCQKDSVEEPENLIPREKMVDIIYDLSVLQGVRGVNQPSLDSNFVDPSTYIYRKYKIDSLQFAKSNKYYAAKNIKEYGELYDKVNERLLANKAIADTLVKKANEKKQATISKIKN